MEFTKNGVPLKPGVMELLSWLKERGWRTGLASSSREANVRHNMEVTGMGPYFDTLVCGDMLTASKPAPDIYLRACAELGVEPSQSYAVEDSRNGILSASSAGMKALLVPDMVPPDDLMKSRASGVFPDLFAVRDYLSQETGRGMIQDIAPWRFGNEFLSAAPSDDDNVLDVTAEGLLLRKNGLRVPTVREWRAMNEGAGLVYAFRLTRREESERSDAPMTERACAEGREARFFLALRQGDDAPAEPSLWQRTPPSELRSQAAPLPLAAGHGAAPCALVRHASLLRALRRARASFVQGTGAGVPRLRRSDLSGDCSLHSTRDLVATSCFLPATRGPEPRAWCSWRDSWK